MSGRRELSGLKWVPTLKGQRCSRCGRKYRGRGPWNMTMRAGVVVGLLCPACQTPEENAEAEINLATLDYGQDSLGRIRSRPKGVDRDAFGRDAGPKGGER